MGGYQYTGIYYSSSYDMKLETGVDNCKKRMAFDEAAIKKEYEENLQLINGLIGMMIEDTKCVAAKDLLHEYQNRLRKHKDDYDTRIRSDIAFLPSYFVKAEPQRKAAYTAAFSSICNGNHHVGTSFIDLDGYWL